MNENKRKGKAALKPHLMALLSKFFHKQFCVMSVSYRTSHTLQHSISCCHATPEKSVWSLQSLWDFLVFDDTVTKPCLMDELCNSKAETEKRNDHFSYWPPGCCLLRLPQWNLNVLLLYSWIIYSCWPYYYWGQPAPCFITWENLSQKACIF